MSSDAFDRKLGPIYDALDARSYKAALKHSDAALKKYAGNQLFRALRAFALEKCNRRPEALSILDSIVAEGPESERVLHTMYFTYKSAGAANQATAAYIVAAEKHPDKLDIMLGLFMAYARDLNFVKQQQVALKLSKLDPSKADDYGWWAVCCIALQARAALSPGGAGAAAAEPLMKLADTMSARLVHRAGGLPSYEALLLRADILMGQGKGAEAAKEIEATSSMKGVLAGDRNQLYAAALFRAGDFSAAAAKYRELCVADPSDWYSWHLYLDALIPESAGNDRKFPVGIVGGLTDAWDKINCTTGTASSTVGTASEEESRLAHANAASGRDTSANAPPSKLGENADEVLGEAEDTLSALLEADGENLDKGSSRGAPLAGIELGLRYQRVGGINVGMGILAETLVNSVASLSFSFGCTTDLRSYLGEIKGNEVREWLAEGIKRKCEGFAMQISSAKSRGMRELDPNSKKITDEFQCRVNVHALLHEIGLPRIDGVPAAVAHARTLIELYSSHLHLSENLDPKERGYGEELVTLAAGALITAAQQEAATQNGQPALPLLLALLSLEAAQVKRTVSAPFRLACCAIYGLLGASRLAAAQLSALDIKSILHDSMTGHWALPFILGAGASQENLKPWLTGIANLHIDQAADAKDCIFTAFEQGTYSKVPEFVDFLSKLDRSHTRVLGSAEGCIETLRAATGSSRELRNAAEEAAAQVQQVPEHMSFNDDLSTRPAWLPPPVSDPRMGLVSWWESSNKIAFKDANSDLKGYADCWWTRNGAAQGPGAEAAAWRDRLRRSLEQRTALPELLAGVLSGNALPQEDLLKLQGILDKVYDGVLSANQGDSTPASEMPSVACCALLSAGLAVHAACAGTDASKEDSASSTAATTAATTKVAEAAAAFHSACTHALHLLKNRSTPQLPPCFNDGFSLAAALLTEEGAWTAACLPVWIKLAKASTPALGAALTDFAAQLGGDLAALDAEVAAIKDLSSSEVAAGMVAELVQKFDCQFMWSFEPDFNPESVLVELFEDQKAAAGRLHTAAARSLALLKPWTVNA